MAKLKFRKFVRGKMSYDFSISDGKDGGPTASVILNDAWENDIMISTPLVDTNGIQIYESDIVKLKDRLNEEDYSLYIVGFNGIKLTFEVHYISEKDKKIYNYSVGDLFPLSDWTFPHLEIVGNIHEGLFQNN